MFRLAHLSDIHLGPLPELSFRELATKRVIVSGITNSMNSLSKKMTDHSQPNDDG